MPNNVCAGPGPGPASILQHRHPHHHPPDKASWTWRYSARQRDNPFRGPSWRGKSPRRSTITSFTFWLAFGSPRPAPAKHMARTVPDTRIPNSRRPFAQLQMLAMYCISRDLKPRIGTSIKHAEGFEEHNAGSCSSRPASCATRLRRPGITHLLMKS